jgi:trk system potassium uptake protein TrkA
MRFVIVGCGRVGSSLANLYSEAGHQVSVVDEDEDAASRLSASFSGEFTRGVGLDIEVLRQVGVEEADVCIACTDGDNTNLVVAQVAHEQFKVPCVVVRVFDPSRADFYSGRGLRVVCPVALTVNMIHEAVSDFRGEEIE